jgi:MraZ protein
LTFRGTFDHSLDVKHRLTVPAKFRAALAGGVVLAKSTETEPGAPKSIAIWTPEGFDEYARAALGDLNPMSPRARIMKQTLNANSHDTELDSAYRVMLPAQMCQWAGLDKEVVVSGSGDCLEIWDRVAHTAYNEAALTRFPELAASLGHTT